MTNERDALEERAWQEAERLYAQGLIPIASRQEVVNAILLASAPSAPQPTEEPSIEGLVMTAQHYLGADFGTPPLDKRASFLLAAIHHLGGALRGMVEAYTAKRDAYERMRANYEMSAEARAVRSIAAMLGWENVPPQDVLEAEIRALKARASASQEEPTQANSAGLIADAKRIVQGLDAHVVNCEIQRDTGLCLVGALESLSSSAPVERPTMDAALADAHAGYEFAIAEVKRLRGGLREFIWARGRHDGEHGNYHQVCGHCEEAYVRAEATLDTLVGEDVGPITVGAPAETREERADASLYADEFASCNHCGWISKKVLCPGCGRDRDSGILPLDSPLRHVAQPSPETPAPDTCDDLCMIPHDPPKDA